MKIAVKTERVPVTFAEVPRGSFFYEQPDEHSIALLKIGNSHGTYQRWGTRYEPRFSSDCIVYVDRAVEQTETP